MKRIYKAVLEFFKSNANEVGFASIVQNDRGGWSIELAEIKIGNYPSAADALKVAKHYNFFNINESE